MKIKTKVLSYDEVMALPRPAPQPPRKPDLLLRTLVRAAGAADLRAAHFSYRCERMEALGPGPYLILMNHSSFIDLEIVSRVFYPKPYCIVCTSDGFVGKEGLMRRIGCIPTNKFVTDVSLLGRMRSALELGCSVLLYPEASYSFDGTATPLPRRLGVMLKRLGAPVVGILTEGAFARDPLSPFIVHAGTLETNQGEHTAQENIDFFIIGKVLQHQGTHQAVVRMIEDYLRT